MKKLLITRRLPDANLQTARARYEVTLREETTGLTMAEAATALASYDAILLTLGDQFSAGAFTSDIRCGVLACLLYTSPSPRDKRQSRMPSSA